MTRILCLDIGDKKIGVAVSNPLGATAQGLATLIRTTFAKDCAEIIKWMADYEVSKIVAGLPLDLKDQEGPQARKVRFFCEGLKKFLEKKKISADMEFIDESFSSRDAERILISSNVTRKKRKKVIDTLAAVLILQEYLDSHS